MDVKTPFNKSDLVLNSSVIDLSPVDKFDQCNYQLLFSHLPLSFNFLNHIQLQHIQNFKFPTPASSALDSSQFQYQQQLTYKLCIAIATLLFGLFYSLIGYRFLKLSTFICGFSLGSSIIYLILSEQKQLTLIENLIISLSIGVLFAFVALLVQYIGLFLLGITSSTAISTCILILLDLFYGNKSAWMCILLLFVCATIVASFTLRFQKSLTIVNTSAIGSGLLLIALDFFVENNLFIDYILELYRVNGNSFNMYERQKALLKSSEDFLKSTQSSTIRTTSSSTTIKATRLFSSNVTSNTDVINEINSGALGLVLKLYSSAHARLCWYTWLIFGSYFIMLIVSLLIQFLLTGKNYDHRDSWQKLIKGSRKKRSANLEKIRLKSHLNESSHHHHGHSAHNHSSLSRSSDIDLATSSHNDTLLLVESGRSHNDACENQMNTLNYTVCSSSESLNNHRENREKKRTAKSNSDFEANVEIISFDLLKSPRKEKCRPKTKVVHQKSKPSSSAKKTNSTTSTSTTSSTSSSSSSASSTCQLIPLKLNNNDSSATTTTIISSPKPSAPPLVTSSPPILPSAPPPTVLATPSQIPPPVPTLPPPKLPSSLTSQSSSAQLIQPKINHHRNSSSKDRDKEKGDKSSGDKFRHFYQIRRNNGDVLSQDFMNNLQNKLSSSSNLNTNSTSNENTLNSNSQDRSSSLNSSDKKRKSSTSSSKQKK